MTAHNALTLDIILERFKAKHGDKYDYSLITEDNYRANGSKVDIICSEHGIFRQCRGHHIKGSGCPRCGIIKTNKKNSISYDDVLIRFKEKHEDKYDYSLVNYTGYKNKIDIICPIHGKFTQTPEGHIKSKGCNKCTLDKPVHNKDSTETVLYKFKETHGDKYDYSLTEYINAHNKVSIICNLHGEFKQRPYSHNSGNGCPSCALVGPSNIEIKIHELLDNLKIDYIKSDRNILSPKELDIFIPDYNIAIECNGLYWHSSKFKDKNYHLNKTLECKKQDITLLHFWDYEINNKFNIVSSMIKTRLGKSERIIYARKTYVKVINNKDCHEFEDENHLQGYSASSVKLGLYYDDELVSIMTFGKPRFNTNYEWELIRFCSLCNTNVIGGASKLFKYFIRNYTNKGDNIITYANIRYSNGKLYENLNFNKIHNSAPSYFYRGKNNDVIPRYKAQKHKLKMLLGADNFDSKLTEEQNMNNNNYFKVYDCGNIAYKYK